MTSYVPGSDCVVSSHALAAIPTFKGLGAVGAVAECNDVHT